MIAFLKTSEHSGLNSADHPQLNYLFVSLLPIDRTFLPLVSEQQDNKSVAPLRMASIIDAETSEADHGLVAQNQILIRRSLSQSTSTFVYLDFEFPYQFDEDVVRIKLIKIHTIVQ